MLNIEVEAIKDKVLLALISTFVVVIKGPWLSGECPLRVVWAEGVPDEVCEFLASLGIRDAVIRTRRTIHAANRQQHLLSLLLTVPDVGRNQTAFFEEWRIVTLVILIVGANTVRAEVGARVSKAGRVILWRLIDETNGDIVEAVLVAEVTETDVACLAPVDIDSRGGKGWESGQSGHGHRSGEHDGVQT
jgi:hypothetical protein